MDEYIKIHKAGGVLIKNRRALAVRSRKDKEHFLIPGGKIESGETHIEALKRELKEELGIEVVEAFVVSEWKGEPSPCSEIVEFYWSDSKNSSGVKLGCVFEKQILPWLKEQDLID
jgi:8-oxo-dGTP pyrophosphatase MutT (NUDIX family)